MNTRLHGLYSRNWDKILMDTKANFKIAFRYQEVNVLSAKRINLIMYYENTIDKKTLNMNAQIIA